MTTAEKRWSFPATSLSIKAVILINKNGKKNHIKNIFKKQNASGNISLSNNGPGGNQIDWAVNYASAERFVDGGKVIIVRRQVCFFPFHFNQTKCSWNHNKGFSLVMHEQ